MLSLVLGGGAAKGYAHIGVLKYLDEQGIRPQLIVGASMGALVGGFFAAGFSIQDLTDMATSIDLKVKRRLFSITLSSKGLIQGDAVVKFLYDHLGYKDIEDLPIKYASVAGDINHHCEIIINKGDLVQAIRSSISIPVVFIPHVYYGHTFIDGGFVNPVPICAARSLGASKIIAVNVLRRVDYSSRKITKVKSSSKSYNLFQVLFETLNYAISRLLDYQETFLEQGFMMNIDTQGVKLSDFEKADKAIAMGYKQAKRYKKNISELLSSG